jgi:hypothetical protein
MNAYRGNNLENVNDLTHLYGQAGYTLGDNAGPTTQLSGFEPVANNTGQPTWNPSDIKVDPTTGFAGSGGDFNFGQTMGTVNGLMGLGATGMNIYNLYNQNKMQKEYLGMAREQSDRAKEQWNITKNELGRIAAVRQNLTAGYAHGDYAAQRARNPEETAPGISTVVRT